MDYSGGTTEQKKGIFDWVLDESMYSQNYLSSRLWRNSYEYSLWFKYLARLIFIFYRKLLIESHESLKGCFEIQSQSIFHYSE